MLLKMENLTVQFGKFTALDIRTPICIEAGDRIGIIGSNGAGKSTMIKSILGLVPYQGNIYSTLKPHQIATHMQFNEYTDNMPVRYIMEAVLRTRISKDKSLQELIDYFEFGECLQKRYSKLSGGQKQRFTIIMILMQDAPLTFYDEVTSGLDFETRQKLMEKLAEWYRGKDSSLCIVSHYYEELEQLADKLLILDRGRVVDFGYREELFCKYCKRAVIVLDACEKNKELTADCKKLASPEHMIVLSAASKDEEQKITARLVSHNVNYKRSNQDIESIYINAKQAYEKKQEEARYAG
ncbi:MAG: ABC transporter ATP-binding protein [Eubacterium sp.]|nr:ABC transporter ATP-binding protein [Eubacterium sp.]